MNKLDGILNDLKEPMLNTLKEWVRIPSVKDAPQPGAPFGPALKDMLDHAMADCAKLGFETQSFDGYIGHADMGSGSDEDALAILAHVDVVPVGDGWTVEPFEALQRDGKLYGRGVSDDKGPAVAALYAMHAVQKAGIPLKRKVRLILGCDEESGWEDIDHYKKVATMPRTGFSPDGSYPIINLEKGMFRARLEGQTSKEGVQVIRFDVGDRPNVVPGKAVATVVGDEALATKAEAIGKEHGWPLSATHLDGVVTLTATGITGHAAMPWNTRNAIGQVLLTLRDLGVQGALKVLADAVGTEHDGKSLGISLTDGMSGPLTCNMGIIRVSEGKVSAQLDIRCPLMTNPDMLEKMVALHVPGLQLKDVGFRPPHFVPAQSELVQRLLDAYHEVTGLPRETMSTGGGTYARSLEQGVAFGAMFPDDADVAHQADEHMKIDSLYKNMRIFAYAIVKLAGAQEAQA